MKHHHALLITLSLIATTSLRAATFDWQDKPQPGREAAFRLYVPDSVPKVRSVIALVPGLDGDGRGMADDPGWQALAERTQSALLACFLKGNAGGSYHEAEKWSGKVFLEALKKLGTESQHPEIADAPIALWGHSAGGQFNFNFANWKPERVAAFVVNKGAYYGETISPAVRKVPALWILGEKDTEIRVKNITSKYEGGRKRGALWALVPEPNEGHGIGRSRDIGMVFLEEVLGNRIDSFGKLQPADPAKGWLGDLKTKTVAKNTLSDSGPKDRVWLPGETTAKAWVEAVGGAAVATP